MNHLGISMKEIDGNIQDIHLDETGNLAMVFDSEAIGEHAKQRTMTFRGEWFLNSNVGVPWLSDIMGREYNPALAEAIIKSTVKRTDGVRSVDSFSIRFVNSRRELAASNITISTVYNEAVRL